MSGLRSVIEELRSDTLAELPDALIEEDFSELQRAGEQLEVERLRRLAEIDRRRTFEHDGYLPAASWLVGTFRGRGGSDPLSGRPEARSFELTPGRRARARAEGEAPGPCSGAPTFGAGGSGAAVARLMNGLVCSDTEVR